VKLENKRGFQEAAEENVGVQGDMMSFHEIGERLGISESEAKRTFKRAMSKLKSPKFARLLWDYVNIGEGATYSERSVESKH